MAAARSIGEYEDVRPLGTGGMGEVFVGRHRVLGRLDAIKRLRPEFAADPARIARLKREAAVYASLRHENIAIVYDCREVDGSWCLLMEYVPGESLAESLRREPMAIGRAADVCRQIGLAVAYAHGRGVVHRDLKPSNVLVREDGTVRVLDFGIAKWVRPGLGKPDSPTVLTEQGCVVGTPGYMSPEQSLGAPATAADDVWALGCILYECLAGARAIGGGSTWELLQATRAAEIDWSRLPVGTPPGLVTVLRGCLAKERAGRVAEIGPLLRELAGGAETPLRHAGPLLIDAPPATAPPPNNLARELTSFVGRDADIDAIERLLAASSLLMLRGEGGSGKTRLALRVAAQQARARFPDGIWVAELGAVSDAALVEQTVLAVLPPGESGGAGPGETAAARVGERKLLLVIDNCEHLVGACARLVEGMLRKCPGLTVLATSRIPLGIEGEQQYPVGGLSFPEGRAGAPAELSQYESVRLLVERARLVRPGFELRDAEAGVAAGICRRLGGIPLAIELAAAKTRSMPLEQIARKLDDRFSVLKRAGEGDGHHRTLEACIRWSYELMQERERRVFERLSVFVGGATLEGAEAVCADGAGEAGAPAIVPGAVTELLDQLVAQSVVASDQGEKEARYRLSETLREFAGARLAERANAERDGVRARHARWMMDLAERLAPEIEGARAAETIARFSAEHGNLRAALEWYRGAPEGAEGAVRLTGAMSRFWYVRGFVAEARGTLAEVLGRAEVEGVAPKWRARACNAAGIFAWMAGDRAAARGWYRKALELWSKLGDDFEAAGTLMNLGLLEQQEGDGAQAEAHIHGALESYRRAREREPGDARPPRKIALALLNLGVLAVRREDLAGALALFGECVGLFTTLEDVHNLAVSRHNLGEVAYRLGRYDQARRELEDSWPLRRSLADGAGAALTARWAGLAAWRLGRPVAAARMLGLARRLGDEAGVDKAETADSDVDAAIAELRELLGGGFDHELMRGAAWADDRGSLQALVAPDTLG